MSTTESLRLQLENANAQVQELEAENRRLRDCAQHPRSEGEDPASAQQLQELYEQALRDLQDRQQELEASARRVEELGREREDRQLHDATVTKMAELEEENRRVVEQKADLQRRCERQELDRYRALEAQREKWEEREARLVRQLESLRNLSGEVCEVRPSVSREGATSLPEGLALEPSPISPRIVSQARVAARGIGAADGELSSPQPMGSVADMSHSPTTQVDRASVAIGVQGSSVSPAVEAALLAHQIPPIPNFSGDSIGKDGDTFVDWSEQFQLVAEACQWSDQVKLVNLATHLKGQAYAFYRSCSPAQRASYPALMEALLHRFTPVTIQSVQTCQFHERKQGTSESVDSFAQELRRLFRKAYPSASRGSQEAEEMGKAVLASQFVTGLREDIKAKLAGCDGDLDQLLVKARFEEAKIRDLGGKGTASVLRRPVLASEHTSAPSKDTSAGGKQPRDRAKDTCHGCGGTGHYIRQCPYNRAVTKEAKGQSRNKIATLVPGSEIPGGTPTSGEVQWQDDAVDKVLDHTLVTLHGLKPTPAAVDGVVLGPTPTTTILVEGTPAEALLDTGSPVTIVSLDFLVKALTCEKEHLDNQTIREEVKSHLEPTAFKLRSYSGEALPIVKKAHVRLSRGHYTVDACVQVQMNAPVQVLLGTDLQPRLVFHLVDTEDPEQTRDGILKLEQQDPVQSPQPTQELPAEKEGQPIPAATVHLIQAVKVPARHAKLVHAKTSGLSFPEGCTIAFHPEDRLHQLTGLVVEDALIPAEEEVSLVISNHGVSPIEGLQWAGLRAVGHVGVQVRRRCNL